MTKKDKNAAIQDIALKILPDVIKAQKGELIHAANDALSIAEQFVTTAITLYSIE